MFVNTIEEAAACEAAMRHLASTLEAFRKVDPAMKLTAEDVIAIINGEADVYGRIANRLIDRMAKEV